MLHIGQKKIQTSARNPHKQTSKCLAKNGREFSRENYTDFMFLVIRRTKVVFSLADSHTANFVVNKNVVYSSLCCLHYCIFIFLMLYLIKLSVVQIPATCDVEC